MKNGIRGVGGGRVTDGTDGTDGAAGAAGTAGAYGTDGADEVDEADGTAATDSTGTARCLLLPKLPGLPAAAETAGLTCSRHCRSCLLWKADSVGDGAMAYLLPPPRWRMPVSTTHGNQQESDTVLYFVIYESAHASDLFSRTLVT